MAYIKQKMAEQDSSYELFLVREKHDGETLSGGRDIAYFYFEKDADEYIEFLTNKNNNMKIPRKLKKNIKKGLEVSNKGKVKIKLIDRENGLYHYKYEVLTNKNK